MDDEFDADYWEQHWQRVAARTPGEQLPAHPQLGAEVRGLTPGTALEAGCGEGAEARWLAAHGWRVTAADVSAEVLGRAAAHEGSADVDWVQADLGTWTPAQPFDLVTTFYAHPEMPQLDFYRRLAGWVAPGGTLLLVGHAHGHTSGHEHGGHGHGEADAGEHPPEKATVTAAGTAAALDPDVWDVVTAVELARTAGGGGRGPVRLTDVVVRATRRPA